MRRTRLVDGSWSMFYDNTIDLMSARRSGKKNKASSSSSSSVAIGVQVLLGQLLAAAVLAEAAIPATARLEAHRDHAMAPVAKAFHNQRPQAIAATGFPQPAATGHCSHRLSTTRTCTQTSGRSHGPRCNAAFQQSSKESSNISRSSSSSTSSPSTAIFAQDGHRPSNHCIKTATRPQALHTC